MSKRVRVELVSSGVRELLRSKELADVCMDAAKGVAGRAGDGYAANLVIGPNRAVARVVADTREAYYKNLKDNTLLKAMGGGN